MVIVPILLNARLEEVAVLIVPELVIVVKLEIVVVAPRVRVLLFVSVVPVNNSLESLANENGPVLVRVVIELAVEEALETLIVPLLVRVVILEMIIGEVVERVTVLFELLVNVFKLTIPEPEEVIVPLLVNISLPEPEI